MKDEIKSIYQDKVFAEYWNKRAGNEGEVYKKYVLDPKMFELIDDFREKTVLELGCGNGYLIPKFMKQNLQQLLCLDISEYNLQHAKEKHSDTNIKYILHDVTKIWDIASDSVDIIYSNMLLNEIENIQTPITEAFRVLKNKGIFVFSVTHPAWNLFVFAQQKAGVISKKMKGLGNYFYRGFTKYIMGIDSKTNPDLAKEYNTEFEVEHYQRPLSDYFNTLTHAGFQVRKLLEPELTIELLQHSPRFAEYKDHPVGLIFFCQK